MSSTLIVATSIGHLILGTLATLAVYKAVERSWMFAWILGVGFASVTVYVEWKLGEALLAGRPPAKNEVVVVGAIVGSLIGIMSTAVLTQPEIAQSSEQSDLNEGDV